MRGKYKRVLLILRARDVKEACNVRHSPRLASFEVMRACISSGLKLLAKMVRQN